jgi:hypothetical protein
MDTRCFTIKGLIYFGASTAHLIFIGGNGDTDALPAQKNRNLGSRSGLSIFQVGLRGWGESLWLKPSSAIQFRWQRQMKARSRVRS